MNRIVVVPRSCGACSGVSRALEGAAKCLRAGNSVVSKHDLIHNPTVLEREPFCSIRRFIGERAKRLSDVYLVVPHGEEPSAIKEACALGYCILDLTCPKVKRSQELVYNAAQSGRSVVICGESRNGIFHQETLGLMTQGDPRLVKVVTNIEEAGEIDVDDTCLVLRQSTLPDEVFAVMRAAIKHNYPEAEIIDTGCDAVKRIITSAIESLEDIDITAAIVMGGVKSSNTRNLADAIKRARPEIEVFRAAMPQELAAVHSASLKRHQKVLLTGGASCPRWVIEETRDVVASI